MAYDERITLLREGMHVEDADGDRVGTVKAIYQPVRVTTAPATMTGDAAPAGNPYLKVHVGLPILGKNLYIPSSAIRDIVEDRIILQIDESRIDEQGWDTRPPWIEE